MTRVLTGAELSKAISSHFPDAVVMVAQTAIWLKTELIRDVCLFLRDDPTLRFEYLNSVSSVDFIDHFDVVYHLTSLEHNHSGVLKVSVYGRESPTVPSVFSVWKGADYQEREIWDLMGIRFDGHPNLKRIMLWEGFPGHPLRKDFVRG